MSDQTRTTISQGGRLVIPMELRRQLGWEEGQEVILQADVHGVYISKPADAWKRLQQFVSSHQGDEESLVKALIAERRKEASGER